MGHSIIHGTSASVIDRLTQCAQERSRLAFEQYALAVELLRERVCERIAAGVGQDRWQTGVAHELALALSMSPHQATRLLATAVALHKDMPHTLARLDCGEIAPEVVPVIVSGVSHLDPGLRRRADEILCAARTELAGLGVRRVRDQVRAVAYELDPRAMVDRIAHAETDRRVTIRPEPDCMARVSILLPMAKAVSAYAALHRHVATTLGRGGDLRSRGQLMADRAYELFTGRSVADGIPVAVNLTLPADVLLTDKCGTAHLDGGGAMPAEIARKVIGTASEGATAWVRRLFVAPEAGALITADAKTRLFPAGLGAVIAARDRYCRTPYCDAPIAHIDHVTRHTDGGATSLANGQGLCAACNHAKEGHGWNAAATADPSGKHTVDTTTPTGRTYRSTAPRLIA